MKSRMVVIRAWSGWERVKLLVRVFKLSVIKYILKTIYSKVTTVNNNIVCNLRLKKLLMRVKQGSENVGLKFNIHKTKIMASSPTTSWQIDGETMKTVRDIIFLGSKIPADGDYSLEIKRCLLHWRKSMTSLDSILKSGNITLPTKVCLVKAMVFPVVMYGCESWTIKKAKCQRIDAFELWCWRRFLRIPGLQWNPTRPS